MMRRSSRVYLNHLNAGKAQTLVEFLHLCHDVVQYFVDLFWQRRDFSADLADIETVHRGRDRFGITTRLAQALAKQAKEVVRSCRGSKPKVRRHTVTLYSHFVRIEPFRGHFDWTVRLTGSGAPRMIVPVPSTAHLNKLLARGWVISKSIRLGRDRKGRLFVDFLLEKPRPPLKTEGTIEGLDSNYKRGIVLSDGQTVGGSIYERIEGFARRQKHTKAEIKSLIGHALKRIDFSRIRVLSIEDLKRVRDGARGKFPRTLSRRLSHWLYAYIANWLARASEEAGVRLVRKSPAYTSQTCSFCGKCDRRSRVGERFLCRHCGFSLDADLNAARNLARLGEAGVYGLRLLESWKLAT
jgi:IS605 OrfB family transposase